MSVRVGVLGYSELARLRDVVLGIKALCTDNLPTRTYPHDVACENPPHLPRLLGLQEMRHTSQSTSRKKRTLRNQFHGIRVVYSEVVILHYGTSFNLEVDES